MPNLYRDNSKLIEADILPIDWTVSGQQVRFPLVQQAHVPQDKDQGERYHPQHGGPFTLPKAFGKPKRAGQAENKYRRQGEEVAIAKTKYSAPPGIQGDNAIEGNYDGNANSPQDHILPSETKQTGDRQDYNWAIHK